MTLQLINGAAVLFGLPTIVGVLIWLGKKIHLIEIIHQDVGILKFNVKAMSDHLAKADDTFRPNELRGHSPLQLTDDGLLLIRDIGFEKIAEERRGDFFKYMEEGRALKLKYDVERAAMFSIRGLLPKSFMNPMKIYLYNHLKRDISNVAPTLGIYIRDLYLEAHPEITE